VPKTSAGLLMYRHTAGVLEVLLVHPGGPFWQHKDDGAWSIPKGEVGPEEDPLAAARREFTEETGFPVAGDPVPLAPLKQPSGKLIHAWAVEGDCDSALLRSNTFQMEWPPKSGTMREFPEIDRAAWFDVAVAKRKIVPGQRGFLDQLESATG
jgi:predicted NUDIX family NTP pyrophosphohydrolase